MSIKRAYALYAAFFTIFIILVAKVAYIQFFSSKSLAESAFHQRLSNNTIESLRGNIFDRNGIPFTNREQRYTAFIKSAYVPESVSDRGKVCAALGIEADALNNLTAKNNPLTIETNREGSDAILKMNTDWVTIVHSLNRYDSGTLAKHVIGYLSGKDKIGQAGIEKAYDKELGNNSTFEIGAVTDASKKPIKGLGYRIKSWSAEDSLHIKLTLDYHIQKLVEEAMEKNGISGAVVVEDVVTGDILAMASKPDFDQESIENYLNSSGNELFNKATAAYNLGSVFKIIDAAALYENMDTLQGKFYKPNQYLSPYMGYDTEYDMNSQVIPEDYFNLDHYECTGSVNINGLIFKCSSYLSGGHGAMNLEQAFAVSCNSYFIEMSQRIGYKNLIAMAQKFGLGTVTGISYQGVSEAGGSLPPIDSYYSKADIANLAIGQGVLLATPLQVADMVATVANGGIKNGVNIVDSVVDGEDRVVREVRAEEGKRIISKSTADKIKSLMKAVTDYGTGKEAGMAYYGGAGGKTGSAETGTKGVVHAWFAGYFPSVEPKYSIAVFVENGLYGGKTAAPVFADIAMGMAKLGY
ncbi:MAG: penicillin-binding transpeptidase domain-containing protein [Clostridiaceae bacterium]